MLRRAEAPSFELVGPRVLEHLEARGDATVVLAGFNIVFDALMLHNELVRVGLALPALQLLEVKTLAEKARDITAITYAVGILAFSAIVGFFTALAYFLAHLKVY